MKKNLTPTLDLETADPTDGIYVTTPYSKFWLSRSNWDALCNHIIEAYKSDPEGYELYKATQ